MNFVTIATFNIINQAYLVKGKLESEGIPCIIDNENATFSNWIYSFAMGSIKVKVPEIKYQEALKILKEDFSGELKDFETKNEFDQSSVLSEEETGTNEHGLKCPYCNSEDVILTELTYPKSLLGKLTFGILKPKPVRHYHCYICLNNWTC